MNTTQNLPQNLNLTKQLCQNKWEDLCVIKRLHFTFTLVANVLMAIIIVLHHLDRAAGLVMWFRKYKPCGIVGKEFLCSTPNIKLTQYNQFSELNRHPDHNVYIYHSLGHVTKLAGYD